eukprot:TRINITY_DN48696_c0_g1_i1.p1 TRINITY_DN48696_c0_g1~~TRINITY_DN48696_c0_g1_i1.p1  ORF type:complete len:150 (+),score=25.00 TRINITY_DN48696_c0_g1_i1:168-617(+)
MWLRCSSLFSATGCSVDLKARACFDDVLKSEDFYTLEQKNLAPYEPDLLKIMKNRSLASKNLISFRKHINAKVGAFFVWEANRKGIILFVDARMPNACHRRPPRTKLGSASGFREIEVDFEYGDFDGALPGCGGRASLPSASASGWMIL